MVKVGYFLYYWSWLERDLPRSIGQARAALGLKEAAIPGPFAEQLDAWHALAIGLPENGGREATADVLRVQANRLRVIRNTIVHGLQPNVSGIGRVETGVECAVGGHARSEGEIVFYGVSELEHFAQAIDACRRGLLRLENFNYRLDNPPWDKKNPLGRDPSG